MKNEIKKILDDDTGYIKDQGFKIEELNSDYVKMSYKIKKSGLNPHDIVHGGVLFGLADTAAGVLVGMHNKKCVTINGNINYLKPVKEGKVYAISKCLKEGKRIGYYLVELYDENNNLVATSNFNMYFLDN